MNYGDRQQPPYLLQRIPQGQRMPMQMNSQGMPIQPQHQQQIRAQQQVINPASYQMQQMPQSGQSNPQQAQMRGGTGPPMAMSSGSVVNSSISSGGPRGVFYASHGGGDGTQTQRTIMTRPVRIYRNNINNINDYMNQFPIDVRNKINAQQDPERKNAIFHKQMLEQQRQQHNLQMTGVSGMPSGTGMMNLQQQRIVQQQQQQQYPSSQQNAQMVYGSVGGGSQTASGVVTSSSNLGNGGGLGGTNISNGQVPLNTPLHMQRIPSQGSFGTPPNDTSSQQLQPTLVMSSQPSHIQQQQMMFSGGTATRMGVGVGQPRSFSMTTHHGTQAGVSLAPPITSMASNLPCGTSATGNIGGIPPSLTFQQLNSHQQQQFIQQQMMQQHQMQQQQNAQHVVHQTSSNTLQSSLSQSQLQQPSHVQHLGTGGPASHQSSVGLASSQQNSPMPTHSVGISQPHSISAAVGGPGSQPTILSQHQVTSSGAAGPASVPQQPRSIPPSASTTHHFIGSPSLQQIGGPGSVSSVRPATPSMRSVSSMGGPNSVGGAVAAVTMASGASSIIDQNAPDYKAALEQLKGYAGDCKRLITRLRMDGSKLETSVERVIEVIEGRRVVDLKLIKRLINNLRSTMVSSDPAKGLNELSKKLNSVSCLDIPMNLFIPDPYHDVRHLQIRVPDSLLAIIKAEENDLIESRPKTIKELAERTRRRKFETQENVSIDEKKNNTDAVEPLKKRDRSLLVALATSFSTPGDPTAKYRQYKEITSDGPVIKVECLNGNFILLNETISDELTSLRFPHRFDPDYKPISENSPHVQILVGYKSNLNPMTSSWISPLRLIIPIDYPKSPVQIFDNRITVINNDNGIIVKQEPHEQRHSTNVNACVATRKRYHGATTSALRFEVILDELKMRLEAISASRMDEKTDEKMAPFISSEKNDLRKNLSSTDLKAENLNNTPSLASTSTLKINTVVDIWAEIIEKFLASTFKATTPNNTTTTGNSSVGGGSGVLSKSRNVPSLRLTTVKTEN